MEYTSITPSILVEEEILNGDLICSCTVDAEASFSLNSSTSDYFSIDSSNGNVYLTIIGKDIINIDYPTEPYREVSELRFQYIATQTQTGLIIYQDVVIPVIRVHDSEPMVTNIFVEPTYTENLTDSFRVFEVRTAYPSKFTIIGEQYNNFTVPDIDTGRITLTASGNTYLQTLDWSDPELEMIGAYKIQPLTIQINIEDTENNKSIQYDLELIVYLGNKDNLLPTKNMNELMAESLGDSVGRLAGRIDITNTEFNLELESIKTNTIMLVEKAFNNEALTAEVQTNIENLILRFNTSNDYQNNRFDNLIDSFRSNFIPTIFEGIKTFSNTQNESKSILENAGLSNGNSQDSGSSKAMALGALDFGKIYADYNRVWNQHYTDRKVNLTMADIDYKIDDARDTINTSILNTYNGYFTELVDEHNKTVGVVKENFNAVKKLDYRSSESERWIGNHEYRLAATENKDLTDWDCAADSWKFTGTTLDFNGFWRFHVDTGNNSFIKGDTLVTLQAGGNNCSWSGNTLSINGGVAGTNVISETFTGTATSANYADLAEYYKADEDYQIGTLLSIETKEDAEHEVCLYDPEKPYAGVVSDKPGFILNADEDNQEDRSGIWVKIALTGRVEIRCTRVQGESYEIKKGLYLYPDGVNNGLVFASTFKQLDKELIGISIGSKNLDTNLVLAKVN